ncbi:MAG: hypothetical protein LBR53_12330, partial [Deltaproteobacteria bacterium]|nr:hypothetical protein [Deltaproteobacteria bacterium]
SDLHRYVYHDGIVGIKRILASLYGNKGYVYLCVDFNKRNNEIKKFTIDALDDKLPRKEWSSSTDKMGFFALASSVKIHPGKLLPIYYQRETLEQLFDISKNKDHVSPLDTHDENTYRGHIMLSFMAVILYLKLNKRFAGHKRLNAKNALIEMKNLKCKVYDDRALIKKITKDMREICKIVDIKIPEKIFSPINRSVGGKKTGNSP